MHKITRIQFTDTCSQSRINEVLEGYDISSWDKALNASKIVQKLAQHKRLTKKESIYIAYVIKTMRDEMERLNTIETALDPNDPQNMLFYKLMEQGLLEPLKANGLLKDDSQIEAGNFRVKNDAIFYKEKLINLKGNSKKLLHAFLTSHNPDHILTVEEIMKELRCTHNKVTRHVSELNKKLRDGNIIAENNGGSKNHKTVHSYKLFLAEELNRTDRPKDSS